MRIDGYDKPIDIVATMKVGEGGIDVDFDGTSPVSTYGINVPLTYTQAYASFGVRCMIGGKVPNNAGSLEPVRITATEGSILNAPHPCAVAARHAIGQMLPDVVLGCLEQVIGDVPAEGTSCLWNPMLLGGHGLVGDADYGKATPFAVNLFHTGGTGARPTKDGLSATAFPSGVRNTPVEINETVAPLIVWKKEYRTDSGGAGRYRGGTGQVMVISHAEGAPFAISSMFDRMIHPPRGRKGGAEAENAYAVVDAVAKPGTELNRGLRAIRDADPSFDPKVFVDGAKMAYEMIVMAYADGDRRTLKNLLSREVYDGFVAAISDRESRNEKIQSSFVGIDKAEIVNAEMKGSEAHVTLRVVSQLVSATRNAAGEVIDGDPETVAEVKDVWTFARDTRSRDPNWKLVATEADD